MRSDAGRTAIAEVGGGTDPTEGAVARAASMPQAQVAPVAYIREKKVEDHLRAEVKKRRDRCELEKHVSPGKRGVPDDLITWGHPLCIMELIETKAPKGDRAKHQIRDHARRARLGIKVHTLYTVEEVDNYFRTMDHLMSLTT